MKIDIRQIENPENLKAVEDLQRLIWAGDETEVVPVHLLRAAVHSGGLIIGAFRGDQMVGFVFGFVGMDNHGGVKRIFHASHMAGVHPEFRDSGLGFKLKRAQWQMVRYQGLDLITWTYDPLQSRNANLNISKLGAVCNTYIPNFYGEMRDSINVGMPSDRFQVDWWVNSNRVKMKLKDKNPKKIHPSHYLSAEIPAVNKTYFNQQGYICPEEIPGKILRSELLLLEIPTDIQSIKVVDPELGITWSNHIRTLFTDLFSRGYYVTDFIFLPGTAPKSYYVLSDGDAVL